MQKCDEHLSKIIDLELGMAKRDTEVKMRLDHHGKGIREYGKLVHELNDMVRGMKAKLDLVIDRFTEHIDENKEYRIMIEDSYRVTEKIKKTLTLSFHTILATVLRVVTVGFLAILAWDKFDV